MAALAAAAAIGWWAWRAFPHPREGSGLVLATIAALATAALFRSGRPQRRFLPRAALFAVILLAAQAAVQAGAASGVVA